MSDKDAMKRRADRIEEALKGRGGGGITLGGGLAKKFEGRLHPHDREGKFAQTFTEHPHLAKHLPVAGSPGRGPGDVAGAAAAGRGEASPDRHIAPGTHGTQAAAGERGSWQPGQYGDVKHMPVGARYHTHASDGGHGLTITKKHKDGSVTTRDAAGNQQRQHKAAVGYYAAHPGGGEASPDRGAPVPFRASRGSGPSGAAETMRLHARAEARGRGAAAEKARVRADAIRRGYTEASPDRSGTTVDQLQPGHEFEHAGVAYGVRNQMFAVSGVKVKMVYRKDNGHGVMATSAFHEKVSKGQPVRVTGTNGPLWPGEASPDRGEAPGPRMGGGGNAPGVGDTGESIPGATAVVRGKAGRWVKLNGKQTHVPHHEDFSRQVGNDTFTSPAGSTHVFKNGEAHNAPRGVPAPDRTAVGRQVGAVTAAAAEREVRTAAPPLIFPSTTGEPQALSQAQLDAQARRERLAARGIVATSRGSRRVPSSPAPAAGIPSEVHQRHVAAVAAGATPPNLLTMTPDSKQQYLEALRAHPNTRTPTLGGRQEAARVEAEVVRVQRSGMPDDLTRALRTELERTGPPGGAGRVPSAGVSVADNERRIQQRNQSRAQEPRMGGGGSAPGASVRPELGDSPGRSSAGRMRNYGAMSGNKLQDTITSLHVYGRDPEALTAATAAANAAGLAVPSSPGVARTRGQGLGRVDAIRDRNAAGGLRAPAGQNPPRPEMAGEVGRSSAGRLRNFAAMSDGKLSGIAAEPSLRHDSEAAAAVQAEMQRRGLGGFAGRVREAVDPDNDGDDDTSPATDSDGDAISLPGGGFPIRTVVDVRKAVQAYGRAKNKTAAKRHIIKRAKKLKATHHLPDHWNVQEASVASMERRVVRRVAIVEGGTHSVDDDLISEAMQVVTCDLRARGIADPEGMATGIVKRWTRGGADEVKRRISESDKTAALSVTHAPIGKGGRNWITASKPGNTGQLPAYIQNVRNGIMRGGKVDEGRATAIAIGRVRDWAEGKGNVHPEVRAAAAKAIAEFEAMRAKAHAS